MTKIISLQKAKKIAKYLALAHQTIAVTGGCFDILHGGHIALLQKAKKSADNVFVLLESDWKVAKLKGPDKPIHTQKDRAALLASIIYIDYVVLLPIMESNNAYDSVIQTIHPQVIVVTKEDTNIEHKKRQAKLVGAKIVTTPLITNKSTSKIARILSQQI